VKIEIWSDVVCPWCYIGKRRLEHALDEFEHADEVEITWRSFQLNPDAPREAILTKQYLAARFGPQASEMSDRVAAIAKGEGLDFDSDHALNVNTFDTHRLLHLAAAEGVQDAAKERLLRAHFIEGADLSDPDTLVALMKEAGVSEDRARAVLENPDEYAKEVSADIEEARALGATGVPFFVIDRKYGVSGAQPVETFLQALRTAYA
jgi:predicted DsbA family dithiol-disulfide isomerase